MVFVELWADQETRLLRNQTEPRLTTKPSKRDVEESGKRLIGLDEKYRLASDGDFPFPNHIRIDNTQLSAKTVAAQIVEHFSIPVVSGTS